MAGDTIQFGEDDARRLRAGRSLDIQQLFDRQAVAQTVRNRGHIIHAVDVRGEPLVCAILTDLLNTAVEITDDALRAHHLFAIQLEDYAQHAVRRGVLRPHVEHEFAGI